jgi:hypothetical protein
MINNDILRIELDPKPGGFWIATIFCIEDPVNHLPRVHEIKIYNTCQGNLEPTSVMYELGNMLGLLTWGRELNFEAWTQGPNDPVFSPQVIRQQGQAFWRATEYR